jgi:enoyl-CoA hydratase/carnithine racemase
MIRFTAEGQVGTVTLGRAPVNAIDPAFVAAFHAALDEAWNAAPTVLVIRSTQKCFCAGADLSLIAGFFDASDGVVLMEDYVRSLHALFDRIEAFPAVTLAVIGGPALGGGLELALACDLRAVSTRAQVGLPEARVGMIPGAGGTQRLTRLCGPGVSARLILGGEVVDGTEAARLGIAQWAVEAEVLDGFAAEVSGRIAGLSRQALLASKDCIAAWHDPGIDGFAREIEKPRELMPTQEARERVLGFFRR